jgi:hypothetical protein
MAEKEFAELVVKCDDLTKKRKALEQQIGVVDEELGRAMKKLKANPIHQELEKARHEKKEQDIQAENVENARSWVEANLSSCEHMSAKEKKQMLELKEGVLKGISYLDYDEDQDSVEVCTNKEGRTVMCNRQRTVIYRYDGQRVQVFMDDEGDASMGDGSKTLVYNHHAQLGDILMMEPKWWLGGWFMAYGIGFDDGLCACKVWSPIVFH